MGIFGEDEQETPPRRAQARARKPSARRRNVEVSLDAVSYTINVEYVQNETDDDDGGNVTVDFRRRRLSSSAGD